MNTTNLQTYSTSLPVAKKYFPREASSNHPQPIFSTSMRNLRSYLGQPSPKLTKWYGILVRLVQFVQIRLSPTCTAPIVVLRDGHRTCPQITLNEIKNLTYKQYLHNNLSEYRIHSLWSSICSSMLCSIESRNHSTSEQDCYASNQTPVVPLALTARVREKKRLAYLMSTSCRS